MAQYGSRTLVPDSTSSRGQVAPQPIPQQANPPWPC